MRTLGLGEQVPFLRMPFGAGVGMAGTENVTSVSAIAYIKLTVSDRVLENGECFCFRLIGRVFEH